MSNNKKKPIPDVLEILEACDERLQFAIKNPKAAKESAMKRLLEDGEDTEGVVMQDFSTITLGDYISAAHSYNREMMGSAADSQQRAAYYTLFAFEERAKRLKEHHTHIN